MLSAFNNLCDWLEGVELYTLAELHKWMSEMTENENEDVYSVNKLKQKLQDRYTDHLFFAEVNGRKNLICFCDMASLIIKDTWYEDKWGNIKDESERIELAAAKIIKVQIWEMSYSMVFSL